MKIDNSSELDDDTSAYANCDLSPRRPGALGRLCSLQARTLVPRRNLCSRMARRVMLSAVLVFATLFLTRPAMARERSVTVSIDFSAPAGTSKFDTGVTHEHYSLDAGGDPAAIDSAKRLLLSSCRYQCQAIMGWGADNPEHAPGRYNWASLDARIALIRSMPEAIAVITLCAAPDPNPPATSRIRHIFEPVLRSSWRIQADWMKGGEAGKTDWTKIEKAPPTGTLR